MGHKETVLSSPHVWIPTEPWVGGLVAFSVLAGSHILYFEQMLAAVGVFAVICLPLFFAVLLLVLTERGLERLAAWSLTLPQRAASPFRLGSRRSLKGNAVQGAGRMERWLRSLARAADLHLPNHRRAASGAGRHAC